ncbi:MAG: PadR family transcriptional regulator [Acidimicrobiales bacterium]|jgi:DNA-binding PadR family transcriptional regulator
MKRSPGTQLVELVVLGLLSEQAQHGYELHRRIVASFGTIFQPSWGSLYPALARLERDRAVESSSESATNFIPTTGSLSGELALFRSARSALTPRRQRKVYVISEIGLRLFEKHLTSIEIDDERSFWIGLSFADHLPPDQRLSLINRRRYLLDDQLRAMKDSPKFDESGWRSIALRGMSDRVSAELEWLTTLATSLLHNDDKVAGE